MTLSANEARYGRARLPAGKITNRPYTPSPDDAGWLAEDVWPPLYWGVEIVAEARHKEETQAWARQLVGWMNEEANLIAAAPPQVPMERAGWRHDFYSRATGGPLFYEPEGGETFLDPITGQRDNAPGIRAAWVLLSHERTLRMARSMALLFQFSGAEKYAEWAAQAVVAVTDYFEKFGPIRAEEKIPGAAVGAVYFQPLYDAGVVLMLSNIVSLLRGSTAWSPQREERLRRVVIEERVPFLREFLKGRAAHNMGAFASAAIGLSGELFARREWIEHSINGQNGFTSQLRAGVPIVNDQCDGFWIEGTHFYHFYTLTTLIPLRELARRHSIEIAPDVLRRFEAMFDAPLQLADQQNRLPALSDFGSPRFFGLNLYRHIYEYAAGKLDNQKYGPALANIYQKSNLPRTDLAALAYGPATLPAAAEPLGHTFLPVSKIGVFRSSAPEMWLLFRGGKFVGGHDHPDRLSIFLNAHGTQITSDLGEPGYALRKQTGDYYRTTLGHNTLFADEQNQKGEASFIWQPEKNRARGEIRQNGFTFRRTVFFAPPLIVLFDEYEADAEHRFGWIYHAYGALQVNAPQLNAETTHLNMPPLPRTGAWANFTQRRSGTSPAKLSATWQVKDGLQLRLHSAASAPFEITMGRSIGQPFPDDQGTLILRSPGKSWRVATVLEVATGAPQVSGVALQDNGATVAGGGADRLFLWD